MPYLVLAHALPPLPVVGQRLVTVLVKSRLLEHFECEPDQVSETVRNSSGCSLEDGKDDAPRNLSAGDS